jgi:hypothetical protein
MIKSITELEERFGESAVVGFIKKFSCPLNMEVEDFLKNKAMQSSRLSASQTYLVIDDDTYQLQGYYTLVVKSYAVKGLLLSSSNRRLISRFAEEDESGNFHAAVYLIAQIGKNFALPKENQISGERLIGLALDEFRAIKRRVGGKLVMVERENNCPKLQSFYQSNGFKSWTTRRNAKDGVVYDQMFASL